MFKILFGVVYRWIYSRKLSFTGKREFPDLCTTCTPKIGRTAPFHFLP